jgi:hypothetical protein
VAERTSWISSLPFARSPAPKSIVVRKRLTRMSRPIVTREPPAPEPLQHVRRGDTLAKAGRVAEARAAYKLAAEAFADAGRLAHARSACRLVLALAADDRDAREMLAELDLAARAPAPGLTPAITARVAVAPAPAPLPPPATFADSGVVPALEPVLTPSVSVSRRTPTPSDHLTSLGLVPLADGDELLPIHDFDPATGHTTVSRSLASGALAARTADLDARDDELYLDLSEVFAEQDRLEESGSFAALDETTPLGT